MTSQSSQDHPTAEDARLHTPRTMVSLNEKDASRVNLTAVSDLMDSDLPQAETLAKGAMESARLLDQPMRYGEAAMIVAGCHMQRHELTLADEMITEALQTFERIGKRNFLGRAYMARAGVCSLQDRLSLALGFCTKALKYPDLRPTDRAEVFSMIGLAIAKIVDLAAGLVTLEQQALPAAERSGHQEQIIQIHLRATLLAHHCALWSAGIPSHFTVGMKRRDDLLPATQYQEKAMRFLRVAEARGAEESTPSRTYFLTLKGSLVSLLDGFESARPIFAQGHAAVSDRVPRSRTDLLVGEGIAARIAGQWQHALHVLGEVQRLPLPVYLERVVSFELAQIYRALGRSDDALQALEKFTRLQSSMSLLEKSSADNSSPRRRRGEQVDLSMLRAAVAHPTQPPALKRATQYVESNLKQPLVLAEVSRHCGVSVRTLQNLYKNHRGVSASAFIKERKLQHAHDLLLACVSVNQASEAIGYSTPANFSRAFTRRFGCAPSDVQRMAQPA